MMRRGRPAPMIARAVRKLSRWPGLVYSATRHRLHIPVQAPGGFAIRIQARRRYTLVQFEGWTRRFDRDDDALECLELGLSDSCRLAVTLRGQTPVAWTVEMWEYGMWAPHHRAASWLVPFWRPRRIEHRQNRVIVSRRGIPQGG
jgi:hypothetical protein